MRWARTGLGILLILCFASACSRPPSKEAIEFQNRVISDLGELVPPLVQVLPTKSTDSVSKLLVGFFNANPNRAKLFAGFIVFDDEGRVISAYSPFEDATQVNGQDFSSYEEVKRTLKKHDTTTMVLYYLSNGRRMTLPAVNLPLKKGGAFEGILSAFFLKSALDEEYRISLEDFRRLKFSDLRAG
ncbi:MAG: cache domain-containing protein [Deltaproteobacteria bacterium]|nr:cache domain-containing protein [Deltaproteobacteria bacterium]